MADGTGPGNAEGQEGESGGAAEAAAGGGGGGGGGGGLTEAQTELLERCLRALQRATNDSHTLAALLLITRVCPAKQLDRSTLKRVFEAVGLGLPARLLVTAARGADASGLPPRQLLSLGTALLAALSADPDMAAHPQLLATVPILLGLLADAPVGRQQREAGVGGCREGGGESGEEEEEEQEEEEQEEEEEEERRRCGLDPAMAADCYQVLGAVCALPNGPEQLLGRGAVPALCRALRHRRSVGRDQALALLGCLLAGGTKDRLWSKHPAELLAVLARLSADFCRAGAERRLGRCAQLALFLPPAGVKAAEEEELRGAVAGVWAALRPLLQSKMTAEQTGPVLVLSACLLDLFGWEPVGPPRFCCLLVNRACVEVRMGLEEPPGRKPGPEVQNTLTACYRIMEAAIEQACCQGAPAPPARGSAPSLTLQQSRQVLGVLEEAFSAQMYHLQQVDAGGYAEPFVFATFRCLCSWLAEETSRLREQLAPLLPFLIGYSRSRLLRQEEVPEPTSPAGGRGAWAGSDALRYLLPALGHLSAEEGPRKALLALDAQGLLVDFLSRGWTRLRAGGRAAPSRDPGMETACSVLLNMVVGEPERVSREPSFGALEDLLSEALPLLEQQPGLLVLAANVCTLGLMVARLRAAPPSGPNQSQSQSQRRFFSAALRLLLSALGPGPGPLEVGSGWGESWDEAAELWRLGLQALGGCVRAQPWTLALLREDGWLQRVVGALARGPLDHPHTQAALEEALCAVAEQCPAWRLEMGQVMRSGGGGGGGALGGMRKLQKLVELE